MKRSEANLSTNCRLSEQVDCLRFVYSSEQLQRLRSRASTNSEIAERVRTLDASGPYTGDDETNHMIGFLRGKKAAWDTYITSAFACGLMEGSDGKDRIERLRDLDEDHFSSSMAECFASWYCASHLKFNVFPGRSGRNSSKLDFTIQAKANQLINVEVKSPKGRETKGHVRIGDDSHRIEQCIEEANKQVSRNEPNLLIIAPRFERPVYTSRRQLLSACFGYDKIVLDFDPTEQRIIGEPRSEFFPTGRLLRQKNERGRRVHPRGIAKFRSISAVMVLEERFVNRYEYQYASEAIALLVENPNAQHPVSDRIWGDIPCLSLRDGSISWSDGHNVYT